jgi:glucose-6-phosphate isomerase/transaldolase/glucose-6-phosphate isomerase
VRRALLERYRVATTAGFGPRYLHSTGQYHKDGPNTGVFIQIVQDHAEDIAIPGVPYTFGQLHDAQALGDLQSLRGRGRRIARVSLEQLEAHVATF